MRVVWYARWLTFMDFRRVVRALGLGVKQPQFLHILLKQILLRTLYWQMSPSIWEKVSIPIDLFHT